MDRDNKQQGSLKENSKRKKTYTQNQEKEAGISYNEGEVGKITLDYIAGK